MVIPPAVLPSPVLESGGSAPGLSNGEVVAEFAPIQSVALSPAPAEILAVSGRLQPFQGGVNGNDQVIWAGPPFSLRVVARSGQPVPPPAVGRVFTGFSQVAVNAAGQLAILARGTSDFLAGTGILRGTADNLSLIVRAGDFAPERNGLPFGIIDNIDQLALNASGDVVFRALVRPVGSGLSGLYPTLYRWTPASALRLVARQGETWPGAPAGWTLSRIDAWNLNARGHVAFYASASANTGFPGTGLWITGDAGELILLAQARIPSSVASGALAADVLGSPPSHEPSGGEDGRARFLSDTDKVAFSALLSDGSSGIFLGAAGPVDDEFAVQLSAVDAMASILPAFYGAGLLTNGVPLDRRARLAAQPAKSWLGGIVRFEIVANANPGDRLGITPSAFDADAKVTPDGSAVLFRGVPIGALSHPTATALEVKLNSAATTEGVSSLIRSLAYGFTMNLATVIGINPRHAETNRVLRLRVTDAAGREREATRRVQFPRTVALAFADLGPDNVLAVVGDSPSGTEITACFLLRLSDGTRVALARETYLALGPAEWSAPGFLNGIRRMTVFLDGPCASFVGDSHQGFSVQVKLLDWEGKGSISWRPQPEKEDPPCVAAFLQLLLALLVSAASASPAALIEDPSSLRLHAEATSPASVDFLANPYALRDWMRTSDEGRRLIRQYERHSPELIRIMLTNSVLLNDTAGMLGEFMQGLNQFLAGKGDDAVIRPDMVEQVNRVWDAFAAAGSAELKAAIDLERARFNGLQQFTGKTFAEWGQMLGWGAPASPFITLSSPRREAGRFIVEANYVAGMEYVLQRAPALRSVFWETVTNATLKAESFKIELTDPTAGNGPLYYRLQVREAPLPQ